MTGEVGREDRPLKVGAIIQTVNGSLGQSTMLQVEPTASTRRPVVIVEMVWRTLQPVLEEARAGRS